MRILSNADVEQLLSPQDVLDTLEVAYRELEQKRGANRPRNHTYFPVEDERYPGFRFRFKSQEGGNVSSGVWGTRITSDMAGVETLPTGEKRSRLLPLAPGGDYVGLVTLFSLTELAPLAIIHHLGHPEVPRRRDDLAWHPGDEPRGRDRGRLSAPAGRRPRISRPCSWSARRRGGPGLQPDAGAPRAVRRGLGGADGRSSPSTARKRGRRLRHRHHGDRGDGPRVRRRMDRAGHARRPASRARTAPRPAASSTTRPSTALAASSSSAGSRSTTTSSSTSWARSTAA